MNDELIPLEFDNNGFVKYWIDKNDYMFGFSLWKKENKNSSCVVTKIPTRFKKYFKDVELKNNYKKLINI